MIRGTKSSHEPAEDENKWKPCIEEIVVEEIKKENLRKKSKVKANLKELFWHESLKIAKLLRNMVQKPDESILEYMKDIQYKYSDASEPVSLTQ